MNKYALVGAIMSLVAVLGVGTTVLAAGIAAKYPRAVLIGAVPLEKGEKALYKITDGANTCYIIDGNLPVISCMK